MATTSCEPKCSSAYSDDLSWWVVYQREGLGLSYERIAANLSIDSSTAKRIVKLFNDTGSVSKRKYDKSGLTCKLTDVVQFFILQLVIQHPGILLREIKAEVCRVLSIEVEESIVCKFLNSQGFTHQKMQIVAKQRDEFRCRYVTELTVYKADMFIFLDETGCDRRNAMRRYAYSWRGPPC